MSEPVTNESLPSSKQLLPAAARLGPVHLAVTDEQRALSFWSGVLGLTQLARDEQRVSLGAGDRVIVVLYPGARGPVPRRSTGLYHLAIHVPERKELARLIARLFTLRYPNSPTDHTMSETTYLSDPDGNGIELTLETPERGAFVVLPSGQVAARTKDGTLRGPTEALDLESLLSELRPGDPLDQPLKAGSRIGHVHLHVTRIEATVSFYRDLIGFGENMRIDQMGMVDLSLAAHTMAHTLAVNEWAGSGALPPPPDVAGLRHFTLEVPEHADLAQVAQRLRSHDWPFEETEEGLLVRDPSANGLLVQVARGS